MLGESTAMPTIAVGDLESAKQFYGQTLGLAQEKENPGGVMYRCGNGNLFVYSSSNAGTNQATAVAFIVPDVRAAVADLSAKGVSFEHYDLPEVTRDGDIHVMGPMEAAWFKDPSGNILAINNGAE